MLGAEMDVHLAGPAERQADNHRNGTSRKTVGTGDYSLIMARQPRKWCEIS